MTRRVLVLLAVAGCGRVAFDPLADAAQDDAVALDSTVCDELPGVLFCEDFEGTLQLFNVSVTPPSFVVTDDGTRAYRGARALHSRTTRTDEPAWVLGAALPDLTSGELHARWYMYLPALPASVQIATIHLVSSTTPFPGVVVGIRDDALDVVSTHQGDFTVVPGAMPRDRWVCVQLRIVISETAGSVTLSSDGIVRADLVGIDTHSPDGYRNIHAGSYATGLSTGPADLWIDELVAGTTSIPCD